MRERHRSGHISGLNGFFAQRVHHLGQRRLIGGLNRPVKYLRAVTQSVIPLQLFRICNLLPGQFYLVFVEIVLCLSRLDEAFSELRMRYMDKVHDPFSDTLAVQVGYAVFSNDVVDVTSCRDHASPFGQVWHNPGDLTLFSSGRHCNYCLAPPAARRAADKINLAADAAVELIAQRIGADLTGQINLQPHVNSNHFIVLADDIRIVDVFGRVELEEGIVVDEIVKPFGAHTEACDDLAAIERLFSAGYRPAFNQVDNPVTEHFSVDAEVFFVFEKFGQGLGNPAYPAFDCAAVFHKSGNVLADTAKSFGRILVRNLYNIFIVWH